MTLASGSERQPAPDSVAPATESAAVPAMPARPRRVSGRRFGVLAAVAALAVVAIVGATSPQPAAGSVPAAPAASAASNAPLADALATGGSAAPDLLDLGMKSGVVVALLFVTLKVLGRAQAGKRGGRGHLNVLESRQLASKASLHLVAVGDRRLVVGLTPAGMVALAELDADELAADPADAADAEEAVAPSAGARALLPVPASLGTLAATSPLAGLPGVSPLVDAFARRLDGFIVRLVGYVEAVRSPLGGRAR